MIKFTIERFRQFEKPVQIALDPITVLIGANNSGKTAVLQALALFQYCLEKCLTRSEKNGSNGPWSLKKTENVRPDEFGPLPVATPTDLWPQGRAKGAIRMSAEFAGGETIAFEIRLQYNLFNIRPTVAGAANQSVLLIENYLIDADALCAAIAAETERRGTTALWATLENEFRAFLADQIAEQRNAVTERLAARLQDRDRRQNLATVMQQARDFLADQWGDGTAWCDAKKTLSACRQYLQQKDISAQALSHKRIVDAMPAIPPEVVKLIKAMQALARSDGGTKRKHSKHQARRRST
ncbi:MAG TPA: AAA family ATPase [Pirellulales bacterium]|nr:AAA family ATPase [Pirellulales bacterium]